MLPDAVRSACSQLLGRSVLGSVAVGGGDISEARLLKTPEGPVFMKMDSRPEAAAMFEAEACGLELLAQSQAVRAPCILGRGQAEGFAFLLLEYLPQSPPAPRFWESFGAALAALHRHSATLFGLDSDNFIGSLAQSNRRHGKWADFYVGERLMPQLRLALSQHRLWDAAGRQFEALFKKIPDICPEEPPALIHGDLWSGNFLVGPGGKAALIDPSVCYAHREMDLAMSRLFGGFGPAFYQAYREHFPTAPGLEDRLDIYQLYYLLVHVNLFGGGYSQSVKRIVQRFDS